MDFKHKIEDDMVTIVVPKDSVMIMSEDSRCFIFSLYLPYCNI